MFIVYVLYSRSFRKTYTGFTSNLAPFLNYWSVPFFMKKIDKLILKSFIGPFVMTFFTVVFILLTRHMLMYFDDIIGKDLGWTVLGELLFHFSVFMIPAALPLAILLACLIVF